MYLPDKNRRLSKYGVGYSTEKEKNIKYYVDADFSDGWNQEDVDNTENVISRTGYEITWSRA